MAHYTYQWKKNNIGSKTQKRKKNITIMTFSTYGHFSLYRKRKNPFFFSKDLILQLKLHLAWCDPFTPVSHTGSKAYFPNQFVILDPKQNNWKKWCFDS